jgi:hypothetical protein
MRPAADLSSDPTLAQRMDAMRVNSAAVVLLAVPVLILGGCSTQKLVDEPIVMELAAPVAVDVQSFNGDVIIEAGPDFTVATVQVVRRAKHGYMRYEEAKDSLEQISYIVGLVPGELGQVLQVRTTTDNPEPYFQEADVYITLPEADGIFVRTTNGRVEARGVEGRIDIATTNNDVRILSNRPLRRPVTVVNRNGDIVYRVRAESTGDFDCETVNGLVVTHVEYGQFLVSPTNDQDTMKASFNGGTNRIALRTVDGDIIVSVVDNPEDVGWLVKE